MNSYNIYVVSLDHKRGRGVKYLRQNRNGFEYVDKLKDATHYATAAEAARQRDLAKQTTFQPDYYEFTRYPVVDVTLCQTMWQVVDYD